MNVLIVEDDLDFRETLQLEFSERGYSVLLLDSIEEITQLTCSIDYAVVDLRLRDKSGLDFLPVIRRKYPAIKMTMLTAYGSVATTVQAIKAGADNYILKPCSFDELLVALEGGKASDEPEAELFGLYKKEREYIEYVLSVHDGNITKAAESLGIRRQSLQRKLRKYPPKS